MAGDDVETLKSRFDVKNSRPFISLIKDDGFTIIVFLNILINLQFTTLRRSLNEISCYQLPYPS